MRLWDIKARWYENIRTCFLFRWITYRERANIGVLAEKAGAELTPILDIGAGAGGSAAIFAGSASVYAVDSSLPMLRAHNSMGTILVNGDALCLPVKNSSFALAAAVGLTEYISDLKLFFEEAARVVVPGGCFITTRAQANIFNAVRTISGERVRCHSHADVVAAALHSGLILEVYMKSIMQVQYLFKKQ